MNISFWIKIQVEMEFMIIQSLSSQLDVFVLP